jgi:hypothetical protein
MMKINDNIALILKQTANVIHRSRYVLQYTYGFQLNVINIRHQVRQGLRVNLNRCIKYIEIELCMLSDYYFELNDDSN